MFGAAFDVMGMHALGFADVDSADGRGNRAGQDVSTGNEARLLKRPAAGDVRGIATGCRHIPLLVADPLQLLNQIRAEAAPSEWFGHCHVNVAIGPVVMEKAAAGPPHLAT